jgi:hypothetical protein
MNVITIEITEKQFLCNSLADLELCHGSSDQPAFVDRRLFRITGWWLVYTDRTGESKMEIPGSIRVLDLFATFNV